MYLQQEYKFHFLSFLGQGGFKISNSKKKKIHALITPPPVAWDTFEPPRGIYG